MPTFYSLSNIIFLIFKKLADIVKQNKKSMCIGIGMLNLSSRRRRLHEKKNGRYVKYF